MDGMPPLHHGLSRKRWAETMNDTYEKLCRHVAAGKSTFINPYAATITTDCFHVGNLVSKSVAR
jgi:Mlc titration factor MtfA (ptsG expression regulator)